MHNPRLPVFYPNVCVQMNKMPWKIVKILSYIALGVQIDKGTFRTLDTGTTHPHTLVYKGLSLPLFLSLAFPGTQLAPVVEHLSCCLRNCVEKQRQHY